MCVPLITIASLLREMTDVGRFTHFPKPPYIAKQESSYDRASTSPEKETSWFANNDAGYFLRMEKRAGREEFVMLDAEGPGCVTRIWSANPEGKLRVYIDGAEEAELLAPMGDLLRGKIKPFLPPLGQETARGCTLYFPIPFARRCKITSDKGGFYFHVGYRIYPEGPPVESFSQAGLEAAQNEIDRAIAFLTHPELLDLWGKEAAPKEIRISVLGKTSSRLDLYAPQGGGAIRELRLRPSTKDARALRGTVLSMSFDGEETVRAPLGDFFGTGPGFNLYESLPLSVLAEGTLLCRWPMPFRKLASLELRGTTAAEVKVEGHAMIEPYAWDEESLLFHAKWRAAHELKTSPPRDWNLAALEGRGLYAGNCLNVANPVRAWWGEGDEKIYVDGESFPSHFGTGTEDYYGYAWCDPRPFEHAYHAQTRCDGPGNFGHTSVNRWHLLDAMPFSRSLRFDMEILHWNRETTVAYDAVSFWYARPGSKDNFPEPKIEAYRIPPLPEMRIKEIPDAIEGEGMKVIEAAGSPTTQDMSGFSGGLWSRERQFFWTRVKPGDKVVLAFDAPRAGRFRVVGHFTKAADYGVFQLYVNGRKAGKPVDLWNDGVAPSEPRELGVFDLQPEGNRLTVEAVGTNDKANPKLHQFGLDCIVLKPKGAL